MLVYTIDRSMFIICFFEGIIRFNNPSLCGVVGMKTTYGCININESGFGPNWECCLDNKKNIIIPCMNEIQIYTMSGTHKISWFLG